MSSIHSSTVFEKLAADRVPAQTTPSQGKCNKYAFVFNVIKKSLKTYATGEQINMKKSGCGGLQMLFLIAIKVDSQIF